MLYSFPYTTFKHSSVEYEFKQTELVNLLHTTRRESLETSRNYSVLAADNNNKMEKFAKEIVHHPDIQLALEKIKNTRLPKIYEVGGFKRSKID